MLCLAWFAMQAIGTLIPPLVGMGVGHLLYILLPPVVMAFLLTSDPALTLRLRLPKQRYVWLAIGLALGLNPLVRELSVVTEWLFPPRPEAAELVGSMFRAIPNVWVGLLVLAVVPSITEEFAFRGFILSGLENENKTRNAIVISALLFGFLHVLISLFSQFFTATLLGLVLGLLAVRSRSLLPGVLFHFINNALGVALGFWTAGLDEGQSSWLFSNVKHGIFRWPIVAVGAMVAAGLLLLLIRESVSAKPTDVGLGDLSPGDPAIEERDVAHV
jgi:sodium transport system permease protein